MSCWTTHAYIINLQNKDLVSDILKAKGCDIEIDRYYIDNIHSKYKSYMVHPMVCIQKDGMSDIENKKVEYSFMEKSIYGLRQPNYEITDKGEYKLKITIPRLVLSKKVHHNSRYMSYNDEMHSQK